MTDPATASDATSISEYGRRTFPTSSLLTGFNECQAAAEWYRTRYKDPLTRVSGLGLKGASAPAALWPVLLGAYNSNRFTVKMRPLGGGTMTQDVHIEKIEHSLSNGEWVTTLSLSPYGPETPWQLDNAAHVLGTNTYPTW